MRKFYEHEARIMGSLEKVDVATEILDLHELGDEALRGYAQVHNGRFYDVTNTAYGDYIDLNPGR